MLRRHPPSELLVAASALLLLLAAQAALSAAAPGKNYYSGDGRMALATALAALKFGDPFQVNTVSPIEGVGSQLLTMNVWANPVYWPFAVFATQTAAEVSGLVALGCFMAACYIMARCFDVPIVPSAIAAQLCVFLFAPTGTIFVLPVVFWSTPGNAVVFAPHIIALGLLARLEPGSWRAFGWISAGISALLVYSLYCDPLWSTVNGFSWAVAFAVVVVGSLRLKTTALRAAALGCFFLLLLLSGAAEYLYTLSQYTARVQFAAALDRVHAPTFISAAMAYSLNMRRFYYYCVAGWLLGLPTLHGRPRLLVAAAAIGFCAYLAYSVAFLWLNAPWRVPIPWYMEHGLCPLYIAGAVAGYCGALRAAALSLSPLPDRLAQFAGKIPWLIRVLPLSAFVAATRALARPGFAMTALTLAAVAVVPTRVAYLAIFKSGLMRKALEAPVSNEPELVEFLSERIALVSGQPYRGSVAVSRQGPDILLTLDDLWGLGIRSTNEYGQLVSPPPLYFIHRLLKQDVANAINLFDPMVGPSWDKFAGAMQLFGTRYYLVDAPSAPADEAGLPRIVMPRRPYGRAPGSWYMYEFPRPNLGNYSPTEVVARGSGADIMAAVGAPDFDFTRQVVLSAPVEERLAPAHDMTLSFVRGGVHVAGVSAGTSLVILPLQYSHCLRARDARVRLVRADLMLAGVIFSGALDTDIVFDYGILSPGCRRADLADVERLDLRIGLRAPHLAGDRLLPDRREAWERLRAAVAAIQ